MCCCYKRTRKQFIPLLEPNRKSQRDKDEIEVQAYRPRPETPPQVVHHEPVHYHQPQQVVHYEPVHHHHYEHQQPVQVEHHAPVHYHQPVQVEHHHTNNRVEYGKVSEHRDKPIYRNVNSSTYEGERVLIEKREMSPGHDQRVTYHQNVDWDKYMQGHGSQVHVHENNTQNMVSHNNRA